MPAYEFRCGDCHRRFEIFASFREYDPTKVTCPHCHSKNVHRWIRRVRFARSEESRLENVTDPESLAGLENDPKALGRMMRQMSSEVGEEIGPEFDEVVNRLEAGQTPDEIEKALPELGQDDGMGGMGGMDDDFGGGLDDF